MQAKCGLDCGDRGSPHGSQFPKCLIHFLLYSHGTGLGIFSGDGATMSTQFGAQAVAVLATLGCVALGAFILLKIPNEIVSNRVSDEEEIEGLDPVLHKERGSDI